MKLRENLVLRRIGNEYIVIVPNKDVVDLTEVYTLNETSAWIWEQLKNGDCTIEQIVESVQQHYDVDQETATNDVQVFVNILKAEGLIVDD